MTAPEDFTNATTTASDADASNTVRAATADTGITFYGAAWCGDCRRAKSFLDRGGVPFTYVDLVAHPEQADAALAISGRTNIPVIAFPDGTHQVEPSNAELEGKLIDLGLLPSA